MINNVHARKPLRRSDSADCDTKVWTQKKAVKKNFIACVFLRVLLRVFGFLTCFLRVFASFRRVFCEFLRVFYFCCNNFSVSNAIFL